MARFSASNRIAADQSAIIDLRRPGIVRGGIIPVARGVHGGAIFRRDAR